MGCGCSDQGAHFEQTSWAGSLLIVLPPGISGKATTLSSQDVVGSVMHSGEEYNGNTKVMSATTLLTCDDSADVIASTQTVAQCWCSPEPLSNGLEN